MRIRINNNYYSIEYTSSNEDLKNCNGEICKGIIKYSNKLILLDKSLSYTDLFRVLKHELTHAYLYETQICLWKKKLFSEEDMCEFVSLYGEKIIKHARKILKELWEK